ncbi:RNA polymerase sigma-70 factor (ECF subfamily) [Salirhabdus euzebyi]|uniref:RNA polymerase sigma factor n=1 Tax=Salirhabdus euzebyi TaxID=394506 RepID=A0A841Q8M8_9BACI|nr:sigma-70 family RNA polymerase sigma factor [Salirhabdus euzebyi]MBB6454758.1 RNA polymerase sigma-70 factor (ECF subfamily) [Salirhabdus euzebyi]
MGHLQVVQSPYQEQDLKILQLNPNQAIEVIMDTYGDEIKRLIFTYVKNTSDTDDVTQEVFVTIYRKLGTFQGRSSLKSWLYSIAINKSKDYLRSWQNRNSRLKEKLSLFSKTVNTDSDTPEDVAVKQNESNQLLKQVLSLPIKYREVLVLHYFKELSTKEVGDALHIKEATVRTRLTRGRELLKTILEERGVNNG